MLSWMPKKSFMRVNFWNLFTILDFSACDVNWRVYHKLSIYEADWSQKPD